MQKKLTRHQFLTVWDEAVGREGYDRKLFQEILNSLRGKGLIVEDSELETMSPGEIRDMFSVLRAKGNCKCSVCRESVVVTSSALFLFFGKIFTPPTPLKQRGGLCKKDELSRNLDFISCYWTEYSLGL